MKLTTRITALLITSWMLWHLAATRALAATINIAQGDNAATKFQQVQSGDSVVIGDGVFNVNVTLQGKSNVTITAANVGTVTVSRKPDNTPWAVGTRVTLDGGGTRWGFRAVDCPNLTIKGITLNNGGLRLENCGNAKIQDFISQNGNYGGIETDTPGNPNGNGRASGLNLLRVACQGNGAVGMNLSSYRQVRGSYLYLFSNNPGLPAKPAGWPSGSVLRNGKWYAQVQDSGGGGKWCLLDDVVIDHLWTENNTGIGWWLDVYNQAVTIRHSQFLNQKWVEFNYDAFGSQTEICYGPTRYEDCYFSGDNAWLNVAESNQTTVTDCVFVGNGIVTRGGNDSSAGQNRGVGWKGNRAENNKLYNGATIRPQPGAIPDTEWVRIGNVAVAGSPTWKFDDTVTPPPPDDIVTEVTFSLSPQIALTLNGIALPPAAVPLTVRARVTSGRDGVVKKVEAVQ